MSDLPFPPADPGLGLGLSLPEIHAEFPHGWPGPPPYSGHSWPGGPESGKCRYQEPQGTRPQPASLPTHPAPDPSLCVSGEGAPAHLLESPQGLVTILVRARQAGGPLSSLLPVPASYPKPLYHSPLHTLSPPPESILGPTSPWLLQGPPVLPQSWKRGKWTPGPSLS